jgi:hypothetical protein
MSPRTVGRPWQIYALTMVFALKGVEELVRGMLGPVVYASLLSRKGILTGFGLQLVIQSILFSLLLAGASFTSWRPSGSEGPRHDRGASPSRS